MKQKISILTGILIFLALFFIFQAYTDKQLSVAVSGLCDVEKSLMDMDIPGLETTPIEDELAYLSWIDCLSDSSDFTSSYLRNIYLSIIVIFLIILSWKIDQFKNKH